MQPANRGRWCEEHKRRECVSPRKAGRGACHGPTVADSDKCRMHLGKQTGPVVIQAQAERLLYKLDAPAVTDHLQALQRLAGRALALEETIGQMVNDLRSVRYEAEGGGEQLRSEVAILERAMDRAGRLLVDIAKLNIEERLARVTERQIDQVTDALAAVLAEMGLSHGQQRDAREKMGNRLRAA